ncbi:MAG TPA: acetolactate synthase, partial [Acidimicrobiales bacterium]
AGHSPQFEAPEAWWQALSGFLDGVAGRAVAPPVRRSGHGGELAVAALRERGVEVIFTLSGGHLFPIYDGCVRQGVRIVDVRHEQTATFAAEGVAKLTRGLGVAALTAGPGVTNAISAITTARMNGSPLLVLGGRASQRRWGGGALQELDHLPVVSSLAKLAATATTTRGCGFLVAQAVDAAMAPHRGPVFLDFPMDVLFGAGEVELEAPAPPAGREPDPGEVEKVAALVAGASRPALVAGGDVWWGGAEEALARCVEALRVPTFANGLGRGCLPADHELAFSRARPALKEADVVVVVGTPLDFRLSFGRFGAASVVHIVDHPDQRARHVSVAASPAGDLAAILDGMAAHAGPRADREPWIASLRDRERAARQAERAELESGAWPIHPARIYGELRPRLDRDAVIVCDGGDFVSYAGKLIDSYRPGCWLDPGPYGCLGTGMGYSIAARTVHPGRQVVAVLGDGAFGFAGMDVDSLVRHRLPVVMVVGNNGVWGLEKHPMQALYGYSVATDLQPGCRYDEVVRALGGAGETVEDPAQIGPALDRALAAGVPYLVNVLTDPAVAYPRSSNLG